MVVAHVGRIDVARVRSAVARLGTRPVEEYLFPVIVDAPVSKEKTPRDQMSTAKLEANQRGSAPSSFPGIPDSPHKKATRYKETVKKPMDLSP